MDSAGDQLDSNSTLPLAISQLKTLSSLRKLCKFESKSIQLRSIQYEYACATGGCLDGFGWRLRV